MTNKLKYLPHNTEGRDFVVGDLHGCFDELQYVLSNGLNFNPKVDRLISVGDLIDRGPASALCVDLLYEPWVHAVRGNHEQMMIDYLLHGDQNAYATWFWNGGQWGQDHHKQELKIMAEKMDELPLVIVVGSGENRYNVVHADLMKFASSDLTIYYDNKPPVPVTDEMIDYWQFGRDEEYAMIWGRYVINNQKKYHDPERMSLTFVGHTPGREVVRAGQQMYLDTGGVYFHTNSNKSEQHHLSLACPQEQVVYMYNMMWRTIKKIPFADVKVV